MNIKKAFLLLIFFFVGVSIGLGSLYLGYKTLYSSWTKKELEGDNKTFSLENAVNDMVAQKKISSEIISKLCSNFVYDKAFSLFNFDPATQTYDDQKFQQRVIDCAEKYNVNDYESLGRGEVKTGTDTERRIKAMSCIFSTNYLKDTFNNNKDNLNILLDTCIENTTKSITQTNSTQSETGINEKILDCEYTANKIAPYLLEAKYCNRLSDDNINEYNDHFLCLDPIKLEKISNIKLSSDLLDFLETRTSESQVSYKHGFFSECLSQAGIYTLNLHNWLVGEEDFDQDLVAEKQSSNFKQSFRDQERISHIRQIASALELYYNDTSKYPETLSVIPGKSLVYGKTTYMSQIPTNPTPWAEGSCTAPGYDYSYAQQASGNSYTLSFCLSSPTGDLSAGTHVLTPLGIK